MRQKLNFEPNTQPSCLKQNEETVYNSKASVYRYYCLVFQEIMCQVCMDTHWVKVLVWAGNPLDYGTQKLYYCCWAEIKTTSVDP